MQMIILLLSLLRETFSSTDQTKIRVYLVANHSLPEALLSRISPSALP